MERRIVPATFTVTGVDDLDALGEPAPGSLRAAILAANASPGPDAISFRIDPGGVQAILLAAPLPEITETVAIDATTQPGFDPFHPVPLVTVDGSAAGFDAVGLHLTGTAGGSRVQGLALVRFFNEAIRLTGGGGTRVVGNHLGTDATGSTEAGNFGSGVSLVDSAGNVIGGSTAGERNVIAGNGRFGVEITGAGATGNRVLGNFIGTDASGRRALGNFDAGVAIVDAAGNSIGGTVEAARNVIAGNQGDGILITGSTAAGNVVQGNYVGLTADGTAALGNGFVANSGVRIDNAPGNLIGGTAPGAGNVLSANQGSGVTLANSGATGNVVQGNLIGTGAGRLNDFVLARLGNTDNGVTLTDAVGNLIGGEAPGAGNVIAGNDQSGVMILGGAGNRVVGNAIGTTFATSGVGTAIPLGNTGHGVFLLVADATTVGGEAPGAGNVIAGNARNGVLILGGANNRVAGNVIGLDASGRSDQGNGLNGVAIEGSAGNTVGGVAPGSRNVLSGNVGHGLRITGDRAAGNLAAGNVIGLDAAGVEVRANSAGGVVITDTADGNTIGGTTAASGNVIAGNAGDGVEISAGATRNAVYGNFIGIDPTGSAGRGNIGSGVVIAGAFENRIGGEAPGAGNVIAGNVTHGVELRAGATGNAAQGNSIGTDPTGRLDRGNVNQGVAIVGAARNLIGGSTAAARNVISGNGQNGVAILGMTAVGNLVRGNFIGVAIDGATDLGNDQGGVAIDGGIENLIGGTEPGAGNVIAGNGTSGVLLTGRATRNRLEGNRIGVDVSGLLDVGNTGNGVIVAASAGNTIGGTAAGAGNVISGNDAAGIAILDVDLAAFRAGNVVQGNFIGIDGAGLRPVRNGQYGIIVTNAGGNLIGGPAPGARNVISGNANSGVFLQQALSTANVIQGNFIGVDAPGTGDVGNSFIGVLIADAPGNLVGGAEPGAGNVISGNDLIGVTLAGAGATGNVVQGNRIGTDATGTRITTRGGAPIGNTQTGVFVTNAPGNRIGGPAPGQGNVIAGNLNDGIQLFSLGAAGNAVQGNFIGTDVSGTVALGNLRNGVQVLNAPGNQIGGSALGAGNLISGNGAAGVQVAGAQATANTIAGNRIGTDASGTRRLGNALDGVFIANATGNTIGGAASESLRNVISGNGTFGVRIALDVGVTLGGGNLVLGNFIGTDATGAAALGNASDGVLVANAPDTTIGGTTLGVGNLISGNSAAGIQVSGSGASRTMVVGNVIGADRSGGSALPNSVGVFLSGVTFSQVGGAVPGARNLISGNSSVGVQVFGVGAQNNRIEGNYIGTDASGTTPLGNRFGVFINGVSDPNNRITGNLVVGNLISGNDTAGVYLFGQDVTGNAVQGNSIGTDATGTRALVRPGAADDATARQDIGVIVNAAPGNSIGGTTPAARNLISGNLVGINVVTDVPSSAVIPGASIGTTIQGNYIGTDATGTAAVGNQVGVFLNGASSNTIGGTAPGAGNVISGNSAAGVTIVGSPARGNVVQGNFIGTDAAGRTRLPNRNGVFISGAPGNTIGGSSPAARNVISGNSSVGIYFFSGASSNVVRRNLIGVAADGRRSLGNAEYGVLLFNAPNNDVARRGPDRNILRASGIGNVREFTGPVTGRRRRSGRRIPSP